MSEPPHLASSCLTLLLASGLSACGTEVGNGAPLQSDCGPTVGKVKRVIDGDTVELEDGTKIRYLMIDTPEITAGKNDCYGQEAKDYNAQLVLGRDVTMIYDKVCADTYERLLAYVSVQGREVNSMMVQLGYACVLQIPPNGEDREKEFAGLELEARSLDKGMWNEAVCEVVTCD